ncbi:hypothetical protein T484DRAFT_1796544 [Baffinella frigidus]|nr:hypothetical protein T484DRAFT_1796544 [Cryptophyta sp. CCMP2293]
MVCRFLSVDELGEVVALVRVRDFQGGDIVLSQGDHCGPEVLEDGTADLNWDGNVPVYMAPSMFVVLSGIFSVHVREEGGKKKEVARLKRGEEGGKKKEVARLKRGCCFGATTMITGRDRT